MDPALREGLRQGPRRGEKLVEARLKAAGANAALTFAVEHQDAAEPDAPEPDPAGGDAAVKKALGVFGGRVRPAPKK